MKYKLLKDLPGYKAGNIVSIEDLCYSFGDYPDFFEPIVEKKTYDDLKHMEDRMWSIHWDGTILSSTFSNNKPRSETFLTREEAEDEHKRREWACRKDKFIPKELEEYFTYDKAISIRSVHNTNDSVDVLVINSGLAFRTREECQDAIDNHDLIRLFYTIR